MNRLEFLTRMRKRLEKFDFPQDDINDALSYYEEVFLDAGFGKDEETAASLGSPEELADGILRESGIHTEEAEMPPKAGNSQVSEGRNSSGNKSTENFWLKFIILVLTFPVWFPILISVFAVLFALLVSLIAIVASLAFAGIALIVGGIQIALQAPPIGITCIGIGLMVTGLFVMIGKPFFKWMVPASMTLIRRLVDWIRGLFNRKEGNRNV